MLEFFIGFQIGGMMQLGRDMKVVPTPGTHAPIVIPILPNDPSNPAPGSLWMDSSSGMLKICLAFQLPLVVLALVRIGILEIETLKKMRRIVYFILTIIAAVIVPDVVTGMVA